MQYIKTVLRHERIFVYQHFLLKVFIHDNMTLKIRRRVINQTIFAITFRVWKKSVNLRPITTYAIKFVYYHFIYIEFFGNVLSFIRVRRHWFQPCKGWYCFMSVRKHLLCEFHHYRSTSVRVVRVRCLGEDTNTTYSN